MRHDPITPMEAFGLRTRREFDALRVAPFKPAATPAPRLTRLQRIRKWWGGFRERLGQSTPLGPDELGRVLVGIDHGAPEGDRTAWVEGPPPEAGAPLVKKFGILDPNVYRLAMERDGFCVGDTSELAEWGIGHLKAIAEGQHGKTRTIILLVENTDGTLWHVSQSTHKLDRTRVLGLFQTEAARMATGDDADIPGPEKTP